MSIIHTEKHLENFVLIDKNGLNDNRLSWKATGLYAYLMGLPPNWNINLSDLANRKAGNFIKSEDGSAPQKGKAGRSIIRAAIDELEKHGYIHKEKLRNKEGQMTGWDCIAYELPELNPHFTEVKVSEVGLTEVGKSHTTKDTLEVSIKENKKEEAFNTEDPDSEPPSSTSKASKSEIIVPPAVVPKCHISAGWSRALSAVWIKRFGWPPRGQDFRTAKQLAEKFGAPTILKVVEYYLANEDQKYISLPSMASKWLYWLGRAGGKVLTPEEQREKDAKYYAKPNTGILPD